MADKTYGDRLKDLEKTIRSLQEQITLIKRETAKYKKPHSMASFSDKQLIVGSAGFNNRKAVLPWNDAETVERTSPGSTPTAAKNEHGHSRYSGGALDINTLELVEYDIDWESSTEYNKHNRGLWSGGDPAIAKEQNSSNVNVNKIGNVDWVFNADSGKWGARTYDIDVKNTYFVQYESNGDIALDLNGNEKKAPLWNADSEKTSLVWDASARVWRIYAVYKD